MKKGITPIIAIIVLLFITIALAGTAWTFLSGYLQTFTAKTFVVVTGSAYCTDDQIVFYIVNQGMSKLTDSDFIVKNVQPGGSFQPIPDIEPGKTGQINVSCDVNCSGVYTIRIGTSAGVQTFTVQC